MKPPECFLGGGGHCTCSVLCWGFVESRLTGEASLFVSCADGFKVLGETWASDSSTVSPSPGDVCMVAAETVTVSSDP